MKEIYWYIVAACLLLGAAMPQHGEERKKYILWMACLHAFISAFRYQFLTGDLLKYNTEFQDVRWFGYFSERVFHEGKNAGFYWLMKFLSDLTNGNFQSLLIVTSIIIEIAVAVLIYRYSTRPWLSYLTWNCFGFYIFGFSAVKQAFAMALVMIASVYIFEEKPKKFLFFSLLAGFVHFPALAFVPAYWIAKSRINLNTIIFYILSIAAIFVFKNPIVAAMTSVYYEEEEVFMVSDAALGGRFFMMVLILVCGIVIKGFADRRFEKLFNLLVVAAIFQMFSGFDNVFTRFADYYFQFSILFMPMLFSSEKTDPEFWSTNSGALLPFNERSLRILVRVIIVVLIWYYYTTTLARPITGLHDYLDYHFMWDAAADAWRN